MQWIIQLFRGRNPRKTRQNPLKNVLGKRATMMSMLAAALGATAFSMMRNRNFGSMVQRVIQPMTRIFNRNWR